MKKLLLLLICSCFSFHAMAQTAWYVRPNGNNVNTGRGNVDTLAWAEIQVAVDRATAGDTIHVAPGTYNEDLLITKRVHLIGNFDDTLMRPVLRSGPGTAGNRIHVRLENAGASTVANFYIETDLVYGFQAISVKGNWNNTVIRNNRIRPIASVLPLTTSVVSDTLLDNYIGIDVGYSDSPQPLQRVTITGNAVTGIFNTAPGRPLFQALELSTFFLTGIRVMYGEATIGGSYSSTTVQQGNITVPAGLNKNTTWNLKGIVLQHCGNSNLKGNVFWGAGIDVYLTAPNAVINIDSNFLRPIANLESYLPELCHVNTNQERSSVINFRYNTFNFFRGDRILGSGDGTAIRVSNSFQVNVLNNRFQPNPTSATAFCHVSINSEGSMPDGTSPDSLVQPRLTIAGNRFMGRPNMPDVGKPWAHAIRVFNSQHTLFPNTTDTTGAAEITIGTANNPNYFDENVWRYFQAYDNTNESTYQLQHNRFKLGVDTLLGSQINWDLIRRIEQRTIHNFDNELLAAALPHPTHAVLDTGGSVQGRFNRILQRLPNTLTAVHLGNFTFNTISTRKPNLQLYVDTLASVNILALNGPAFSTDPAHRTTLYGRLKVNQSATFGSNIVLTSPYADSAALTLADSASFDESLEAQHFGQLVVEGLTINPGDSVEAAGLAFRYANGAAATGHIRRFTGLNFSRQVLGAQRDAYRVYWHMDLSDTNGVGALTASWPKFASQGARLAQTSLWQTSDSSGTFTLVGDTIANGINWNISLPQVALKGWLTPSDVDNYLADNIVVSNKGGSVGCAGIYPNPASTHLQLSCQGQWLGKPYAVYNLQGKQLLNGEINNNPINVSGLAPGMYLLQVGNGNTRFVKQ